LEADARTGLARPVRADQARRGVHGRRPAAAAAEPTVLQGPARFAAPGGHLMAPMLEPMVGRYVRLEIEGVPHRIYFEEAGQGIPLVCLHTAGADNRQYRHLLSQSVVTPMLRRVAIY